MRRNRPSDRRSGLRLPGLVAAAVLLVGSVVLVGAVRADDSSPPAGATAVTSPPPAASPTTDAAGTSGGEVPSAQIGGTPASQTRIAVPTLLTLPSGAAVPVDPAGVDPVGALSVPADPARVGWWTGGAQVGEPFGSVVIAGHIDSRRYGVGQMAALRDVVPGDVVTAGAPDVSVAYRVESVVLIAKADLSADSELFDQEGPHRLVLITCDGEYDRSTGRYADNLVVTAVPAG